MPRGPGIATQRGRKKKKNEETKTIKLGKDEKEKSKKIPKGGRVGAKGELFSGTTGETKETKTTRRRTKQGQWKKVWDPWQRPTEQKKSSKKKDKKIGPPVRGKECRWEGGHDHFLEKKEKKEEMKWGRKTPGKSRDKKQTGLRPSVAGRG